MLGPLFAFITLGTWSLSDLIVKYALSRQSIWFISFWGQILGGVIILILGLLTGQIQSISLASLPWIALFSVINIVGMFLFYKSVQSKGVALSLPIVYSWSILSVALSVIFLSEFPTLLQTLGIGAVLLGIFFVAIEPGNRRLVDRGTLAAFGSMLCWGIFYFLMREPTELYGEWWIGGMLKIGSGILSLPFLLKERARRNKKSMRLLWVMAIIGLLDALGLIALTSGLQISSVAVMTGIPSTTPVVVALFGVLLFKEKVNLRQAIGIGATGIGLVLLVL